MTPVELAFFVVGVILTTITTMTYGMFCIGVIEVASEDAGPKGFFASVAIVLVVTWFLVWLVASVVGMVFG